MEKNMFFKIIKESLGDDGYCIRLGGDEFLIFFDTDIDKSNSINQKILEVGNRCEIELSIGYSTRKNRDENIRDLLRRADEALYTAKKNGKGKIVTGY